MPCSPRLRPPSVDQNGNLFLLTPTSREYQLRKTRICVGFYPVVSGDLKSGGFPLVSLLAALE